MRVFVTGFSHVTAIGISTNEVLHNLTHENSGIRQSDFGQYGSFKTGQIDLSNDEIRDKYNIQNKYSRTALLGVAAVKELGSALDNLSSSESRKCLLTGTSVGGMDMTEREYMNYLNNANFSIGAFVNHASGIVSQQIMSETTAFDFIDTVSTACSSAANAILQGANYIVNGIFDSAVVGGTDALSLFTINGFNSLNIYDTELCKPFDENRKGLNLGEGAGFLILESEKSIAMTGNKPIIELSGWGNASDAFHQTASSPEGTGAILSMKTAMKKAQLAPSQIDYINAHGTATPNNDLSESTAIKSLFESDIPYFSSTKPYTGHTLAACGAIEAGFCIYSLLKGIIFPNLNFTENIADTGIIPVTTTLKDVQLKHVLSNSFGFGGNNTSLIFSKV